VLFDNIFFVKNLLPLHSFSLLSSFMQPIIIYSPIVSRRFHYITNEIFERILGFQVHLTTSKENYLQSDLPKVNYSYTPLAEREVYIIPQGLLFEQGVNSNQNPLLPLSSPSGDAYTAYCPPIEKNDTRILLNEDILATSFFLLSRYEEYLPFQADNHGRFRASESMAKKQGFLQRPLINEWAIELGNLIENLFENAHYKRSEFRQIATYDIDQAFKYRNKGCLRNIGGFLFSSEKKAERTAVLLGRKSDPFDTFDYIEKLHRGSEKNVRIFLLLGDRSEFDKNIHFLNADFQNIIKKLNKKYLLGIHPSYQTNEGNITQLAKEKARLEKIIEQPVTHSRQHFLKLRFPETYHQLLAIGIKNDHSMGYADDIGFRASVANPFYWYDLSTEKTTDLLVHPFQIMDVTLKEYLKLQPDDALEMVLKMKNHIRYIGGEFVTLWHNSSFDGEWKDWKTIYEKIIV
jgi:hypothetical protein